MKKIIFYVVQNAREKVLTEGIILNNFLCVHNNIYIVYMQNMREGLVIQTEF